MKLGQKPSASELSRKELSAVEETLGVTLREPQGRLRMINQQFGVYDEDGQYAGDIVAKGKYFSQEELTTAIKALF
ncbi:MAG: hypothetical protein WC459_04885 [Patescibacteria group bacterium]